MASTGGFPGTTGAGSIFFATQGDALSTAVNSGWLEDQSINYGTGVFATRAFVNGTTSFISTGDGTAYYVPGRPLRIQQGATTTYASVAQSSFSAGATIVYVPFNSTGGVVALSTVTAFTGVMAGPLIPGSSGNAPMTLNVAPSTATANYITIGTAIASTSPAITTTGADASISLLVIPKGAGLVAIASSTGSLGSLSLVGPKAAVIAPGTTNLVDGTVEFVVASSCAVLADLGGSIGLGGQTGAGATPYLFGKIKGASEAGAAAGYISLWTVTAGQTIAERARLDSSGGLTIGGSTTSASKPFVAFSTAPASSGFLRLPNSPIAIVGKDANAVDDIIWPHQFASTAIAADILCTGGAGTFQDGPSLSLGAGTWLVTGTVTMLSTSLAGNDWAVKLWDGTTLLRSANQEQAVGASTSSAFSITLTAIASSSSVWKMSAAVNSAGTTGNKMIAADAVTGAAKATSMTAVKIG